jgi:hypothetical protein
MTLPAAALDAPSLAAPNLAGAVFNIVERRKPFPTGLAKSL